MEAQHVDFYPLVIVTLLAVAVPIVLHRMPWLPLPTVVGEILAGVVVGVSGLNLITGEHAWLEFLELFGFVFLMFLSGLEIDLDVIAAAGGKEEGTGVRRFLMNPLRAGTVFFTLTVGASLVAAVWLVRADLASDAVLTALILSTTSLGVVVPVLKQRGVSGTDLGQNILVASVISDFATVLLVSTYVILHTQGLKLDVLLVLVLFAAAVVVYRVARLTQRHLPAESLVEELSHATGQLDTRVALALAVLFIALAQGLGIELILGSFLAGVIVSLLTEAEDTSVLRPKLNALGYGFFIPIFFIMVGASLDLRLLLDSPGGLAFVGVLIAVAFAVKLVAALIYRARFSWRETIALGMLTSSRLSLIIAVSAIGVGMGLVSEVTNAGIVVVAIVTVIVGPMVFNRLVSPAVSTQRHTIIVDGSSVARSLAQRLQAHGERVELVTAVPEFAREAEELGLSTVLVEDGQYMRGIKQAGIDSARTLVSVLDDAEVGRDVSLAVKRRYDVETVIALAPDPVMAESLRQQGVDVIEPGTSSLVVLESMVRHPDVFNLLTDVDRDRDVQTVRCSNKNVCGDRLRDIRLPGNALIIAIGRRGETVIPHGDTTIKPGDRVTLAGSRDDVRAAATLIAPRG